MPSSYCEVFSGSTIYLKAWAAACILLSFWTDCDCLQVVRSDGITGVLSRAGSQVSAEPSVDSNAVKDSLDCLAGIAASSQEGSVICLESAAIPAACSALQVSFLTNVIPTPKAF